MCLLDKYANYLLLETCLILKNTEPVKEMYIVGGAVRDMLIGVKPKDFDLVVDCDVSLLIKAFELADWKVKETGLRFNVLTISKHSLQFEIAQFRNDGTYKDGKPESVTAGTIDSDALRRDFTVNALYIDPFAGEIKDPTGKGLADIKTKTLRFVGKPKDRLLGEDPMRVFRFYRMIQKGFTPVSAHLRAVRELFPQCYKLLAERNHAESVRNEIERLCGM